MTTLNLAGYFLAFLAVCWYNYSKLQGMKEKAAQQASNALVDDSQPLLVKGMPIAKGDNGHKVELTSKA